MDFYKKIFSITLMVVFICTVSGCSKAKSYNGTNSNDNNLNEIMENAEKKQYKQIISRFQEISINEIIDTRPLSENEDFYYYFGRASCLYCREFIIENKELLVNRKNFYYIDTEKLSKEEIQLLNTYEIEEIPAILRVSYDEDMVLVDIEKFIEEFANGT